MIPVTPVGGYLGAGKTTLINHLLRHANGQRLAILVNEFGALSIDADLIEAQSDDVISIAGGCICCSFGNDLLGAIRDLTALDPAPDHIVIEASGVAIPASIAASLSLLPGIELSGVVVLADVETVRDMAQDAYLGDTILRQLDDADLVLATKADLLDPVALDDTRDWLAQVAPSARVLEVRNGAIAPELVLGPNRHRKAIKASDHSDALFDTEVYRVEQPVDPDALGRHLISAKTGVLRAKGFVAGQDNQIYLVQIVGKRIRISRSGPDHQRAIVCIGRAGQLNREVLGRVFSGLQAE